MKRYVIPIVIVIFSLWRYSLFAAEELPLKTELIDKTEKGAVIEKKTLEEVSVQNDVMYVREGNTIVQREVTDITAKTYLDRLKNLSKKDANLVRKRLKEKLPLPAHVSPATTVHKLEFDQHTYNRGIHHERYTDTEAIKAIQEATTLSLKGISLIEGGPVNFFKGSTEENASLLVYGKGPQDLSADRFGEINIDQDTGAFSIKTEEDISINSEKDLNLNIGGNLVLFRDALKDNVLYIYGTGKKYSTLSYVPGTDNFQIANSKEGGAIILKTNKGNVVVDGGDFATTGNLFVNAKGPDNDSYIYFYNEKPDGAYIMYSKENDQFVLSPQGFDIAEKVQILDYAEPGDVIIFSENGMFKKSSHANSKNVFGVISSNPALVIGGDPEGKPLALSGQVKVKVCTQNGPIKIGDFLTPSDTSGYAMKSTEMIEGSILGQALEEFSGDKGIIKMVIKTR